MARQGDAVVLVESSSKARRDAGDLHRAFLVILIYTWGGCHVKFEPLKMHVLL